MQMDKTRDQVNQNKENSERHILHVSSHMQNLDLNKNKVRL
jgi:hypothetical protein